ncbi:MAG: DUF6691 family protein [Burkholderiales bacterium]
MDQPNRSGLEAFFALLSGTLFGLGLAISGMVDPAKVLAFLDTAGKWNPTLAFVMLGALAVTTPAFRFVLKRREPWFAPRFVLPTKIDLEPRLVFGAALFGVGWGLAGLCPGPAVTNLVTGRGSIVVFVAAMLAGMLLSDAIDAVARRRGGATAKMP